MNYTPTEWNTGDIVSSQKLNKLEEGVKGAYEVMVINVNIENGALDKTWQEIYDAMAQGIFCVAIADSGTPEGGIMTAVISSVSISEGTYIVRVADTTYTASSATGYPSPVPISDDTPVGGGGNV